MVGGEYKEPSTLIEKELHDIWSEVLNIEKIGVNDNFFRIGGDSIVSIQLIAKARRRNIYFSVKDVFNYPTIRLLASVVKIEDERNEADQGNVTGIVLLTPIQKWFFNSKLVNKNYYNQSFLFKPAIHLEIEILNEVFKKLVIHHDALRFIYKNLESGEWIQECASTERSEICIHKNLSYCNNVEDALKEIERISNIFQSSFDLSKGPLIKVVLFNYKTFQRLLIIIHHLVVDGISWRIIIEDIELLYTQIQSGKKPNLGTKTYSYKQWAAALQTYASTLKLNQEVEYWYSVIEKARKLPIDFNLGPVNTPIDNNISVQLEAKETAILLKNIHQAYRTEINDILLSALLLSLGDWIGEYKITLLLEGHGREDIDTKLDISRTVGWFTTMFPINLTVSTNEPGSVIKEVKEIIRSIPNKGIGYGVLSYLSLNQRFSDSSFDLSFNYLGQWDNSIGKAGILNYTNNSGGNPIGEANTSENLIDINAEIREGKLQVYWNYSHNHYKQETIIKLAKSFIKKLQELIHHCYQDNVYGYTPSDFELSSLNNQNIENRLALIPGFKENLPKTS
jgi:non-ribosomal peptide synthase protein (TIGR01720 family)